MKKLNLGSGPNSAKGWINYDWGLLPFLAKYRLTSIFTSLSLLPKIYNCQWPKIELIDLRKELPDEDGSVNYIYCSHLLEHFEKYQSLKLLRECRRILKRGGMMRIVLPDLEKVIDEYRDADSFNREFYGYDKDKYVGILGKLQLLFLRGHEWMYDKKSFRNLLKEAGFKNIKLRSIKKGKFPNINKLDLDVHKRLSFYYECQK